MRLLHTSDWHLGRTLHRADLRDAQAAFLDGLVETVRSERVDAVLVAGDVYDRAVPGLDAVALYDDALVRLRDAGARVVVTSGNHDSAARLGVGARLVDAAGVHVRTRPQGGGRAGAARRRARRGGGVRAALPRAGGGPGGAAARPRRRPGRAARPRRRARAGRWPASGPTSPAGAPARSCSPTRGSPAASPATASATSAWAGSGRCRPSLFDGVDYTALGHLHGAQRLREGLRYSGSPLAYSFSEAAHAKGSWLVELDAAGLARVEQVPSPPARRLTVLRGRPRRPARRAGSTTAARTTSCPSCSPTTSARTRR